MSVQANIVPIRQIYIVLADGNFHFLEEARRIFLLLSPPPRPYSPPPPRREAAPAQRRRGCGERRGSALAGGYDQWEIWAKTPMPGPGERPAEPGRDAGDGAPGGQAGGAKGRKRGSGSQTTGILATLSESAAPPPRARCASAGVLEEQSVMPGPWWTPPWPDWLHSPHEPARREPRVRHSPPGAPRKI